MFRSIRWRFIIIYFMLVFIAMIIAGLFIIQSFSQYHFSFATNELTVLSGELLPTLEKYDSLGAHEQSIQQMIDNFRAVGIDKEIFVVDGNDHSIIATTSEGSTSYVTEVLLSKLLTQAMLGNVADDTRNYTNGTNEVRTQDMAFPITNGDRVIGVLYLRSDLSGIFDTMNESINIVVRAILLSSLFTIVLGFFVARTITDPINDVTMRVAKLAQGDFDQVVEVRSDDEIGQLADTFNYLTGRLNTSMQEISREKSKLEAIIHYMDDGLIAADMDGDIIHLNPKAKELLDLEGEVVSVDQVFQDMDTNLFTEYIHGVSEDAVGGRVEAFGQKYLKFSFAPFANEWGEQGGIVYLIQDITEQHILEDMRREFVANVSHELKTPLTSIKSYTETIIDGAIEDREMTMRFLDVVNSEADRMSRLVRDLLQLSNFDARKIVFDYEYNDYITLIQKSIMKVDPTAKEKGHEIKMIMDEEEIVGYFDYDRIEQLILNVLSNAIKYTTVDGKIRVYVSRSDQIISIRVDDSGIGISKRHLQRIFERFYRVDKARSRGMGGTGLGLSIAKEIVEAHGGGIEVESEVGKGTSVKLWIPVEPEIHS